MEGTPRTILPNTDPLAETLHLLRVSGALYGRSELTAPWGIRLPELADTMMFHIVMSGSCVLDFGDGDAVTLERGSLALVPHGAGHNLRNRKGSKLVPFFDLEVEHVSERYEILRHGGGGEDTLLICVVVNIDNAVAEHVISQLPRVLTVLPDDGQGNEWLHSTIRFLSHEARAPRPGSETVVTRLADILVIQTIRAWIDSDGSRDSSWFNAMRDERLGRALSAIYRDPSRDWSVDALAAEASLSRSAFSAKFTGVMGQSAMQYLTGWRMRLSRSELRETDESVGALASRMGYASEAAFCRAYKREFGVTPGETRRAWKSRGGSPAIAV